MQNNPANLIDPFGLKGCNQCDDCPCGRWSGSGQKVGGIFFVVGFNTMELTLNCNCSNESKYFLLFGIDIGAGLGGSAEKVKAYIWGVCNKDQFDFSGGISGAGSKWVFSASYSGSGGIDEGSSIVGYGLGFGTPTAIIFSGYKSWY